MQPSKGVRGESSNVSQCTEDATFRNTKHLATKELEAKVVHYEALLHRLRDMLKSLEPLEYGSGINLCSSELEAKLVSHDFLFKNMKQLFQEYMPTENIKVLNNKKESLYDSTDLETISDLTKSDDDTLKEHGVEFSNESFRASRMNTALATSQSNVLIRKQKSDQNISIVSTMRDFSDEILGNNTKVTDRATSHSIVVSKNADDTLFKRKNPNLENSLSVPDSKQLKEDTYYSIKDSKTCEKRGKDSVKPAKSKEAINSNSMDILRQKIHSRITEVKKNPNLKRSHSGCNRAGGDKNLKVKLDYSIHPAYYDSIKPAISYFKHPTFEEAITGINDDGAPVTIEQSEKFLANLRRLPKLLEVADEQKRLLGELKNNSSKIIEDFQKSLVSDSVDNSLRVMKIEKPIHEHSLVNNNIKTSSPRTQSMKGTISVEDAKILNDPQNIKKTPKKDRFSQNTNAIPATRRSAIKQQLPSMSCNEAVPKSAQRGSSKRSIERASKLNLADLDVPNETIPKANDSTVLDPLDFKNPKLLELIGLTKKDVDDLKSGKKRRKFCNYSTVPPSKTDMNRPGFEGKRTTFIN